MLVVPLPPEAEADHGPLFPAALPPPPAPPIATDPVPVA